MESKNNIIGKCFHLIFDAEELIDSMLGYKNGWNLGSDHPYYSELLAHLNAGYKVQSEIRYHFLGCVFSTGVAQGKRNHCGKTVQFINGEPVIISWCVVFTHHSAPVLLTIGTEYFELRVNDNTALYEFPEDHPEMIDIFYQIALRVYADWCIDVKE